MTCFKTPRVESEAWGFSEDLRASIQLKCPEWTAGHKLLVRKRRKWCKKKRVNVCKLHVCMWFSECWHCPVIPLKLLNGILFLIFNRWVISCASSSSSTAGASLAIDKARNGNFTLSPSDLIDGELKSINSKRRHLTKWLKLFWELIWLNRLLLKQQLTQK